MCATAKKNYVPLHHHKPIPTLEQKVNTNRASYVKNKNENEYIEYSKDPLEIKYYSTADKKTNIIDLMPDQCIYDVFIIQGEGWFRRDAIKSLYMLQNKCREEYDTIRNGILDEKNIYHKGINLIEQSKDYPTCAQKENGAVLIGTQDLEKKQDKDYHKILASAIASEGYRLIYWDEWGPLPEWWNKKEGIKLRYRVLKKLEASNSELRHLEKSLDEEDEEIFFRKLHEKD